VVDFYSGSASHTGGDTVIRFQHANAIYIGISTAISAIPLPIRPMAAQSGHDHRDRHDREDCRSRSTSSRVTAHWSRRQTCFLSGNGRSIILAKTKELVDQGKSLERILAANLTARMTRRRR